MLFATTTSIKTTTMQFNHMHQHQAREKIQRSSFEKEARNAPSFSLFEIKSMKWYIIIGTKGEPSRYKHGTHLHHSIFPTNWNDDDEENFNFLSLLDGFFKKDPFGDLIWQSCASLATNYLFSPHEMFFLGSSLETRNYCFPWRRDFSRPLLILTKI